MPGYPRSRQEPFVDVRETHVGAVMMFGDLALKIKKPVRTAFLDFSTTERRRRACHREIELNRRLAPDVYLGLVDLPGPHGTAGEPAIAMRRMPDRRRLGHLVEVGAPVADAIEALAVMIAQFHRTAHRDPQITAEGGGRSALDRWESNLAEIWRYSESVLEPEDLADVEHRARAYVIGRAPLFGDRQREGRIVDGHGDLLADDIFCLDNGPRVLDCLEFDDRLRYVDGLDDAAFLAMDLEHHGDAALAATFLRRYQEVAGDPAPASLAHHFIAYRALVRAKVDCLRHDQGDPGAAESARRHLALAHTHIRDASLRLVLIGGAPGTGKSTLATEIAARTGATLLSSDVIRKSMNGLEPLQSAAAGFGEGIYSEQRTDDTYRELVRRAGDALRHGHPVVLDASWTTRRHRDLAADLARAAHSTLLAIRCTAPESVVESRLRARENTTAVSDAGLAIGQAMAAAQEPWPTAGDIDTARPVGTVADEVLRWYHSASVHSAQQSGIAT